MSAAPPGRAWIFKTLLIIGVGGTVLAAGGGGLVYWHFSRDLPKIITLADYRPLAVTRVVTEGSETVIGEFTKERRYIVPYQKIPQLVVKAFVSAEDDQFFQHVGINLGSIVRAWVANFRAGHVVQGGSTITQQVAKSLLLTREKSYVRKIKEIILASRMEKDLSKADILTLYLNQIYLGHGAYGVQAAARTYYGKDVADLTIAEAAVLAGLPQAPGKYSPLAAPKRVKERQLYVLRRMRETGAITQEQMAEAAAQPLRIYGMDEVNPNPRTAPYLVEHIRRYLAEKYGDKALYEDGLTVYVPGKPEQMKAASKALREGLRAIDKRQGFRGPLQALKAGEEIEKFLREQRLTLIARRLRFQVLKSDGTLDAVEGMKLAGIHSDQELLEPGELYQAVVSAWDEKRKAFSVLIGAVRAELPGDKMKWALPGGAGSPARVLKKGDVVLVKLDAATPQGVTVSLEQEPQVQGALFSMEAATGNVLAMEGGYSFEQSEFNRATQAQRQPGSAFKPVVFAAALEKGFTPASVIIDSPIVYDDVDTGKWKPANFEEKFYGDTTFRQALIKSRNVPTIKIVQSIQIPFLIDYAKRLGMNAQFQPDLSISLGSAAQSLMDLTKVYALFPRLGRRIEPLFMTRVLDRDGKLLEERKPILLPATPKLSTVMPAPKPQPSASPGAVAAQDARPALTLPIYPPPDDPDQLLDPRVAYVMTHLMSEVVEYGTGYAAKALGRAAAGKTGTTSESIDAWFMGFTPHVVTGVWIGYDNQKPIGHNETGARASLPIWLDFMKEAVKAYPEEPFKVPPGVTFASIDPATGKLAAKNSSQAIQEAFIEGTQPTEKSEATAVSPDTQSDFFKEDTE